MKSYPGKLWKIMNDNGTELQQARFSNIEHRRCGWPRGSAPNSNPHSKYLLQTKYVPLLASKRSGRNVLDMWRRVHFLTLPRSEPKSPYHVWTKATSGMVVSPKAIRFSVNMTLMGVLTYNRNKWQTQGKWLNAHERVIGALVRNETSTGRKWKLIKPLCLVNRVFQSFRQRLEKKTFVY